MGVLAKLLKSNWLNWICCFGSSVLVSTMLFVFEGIKNIVLGTLSEVEIERSQQGIEIQIYMYVLLFVGILLITYTVSSYSRLRLRDYGMYMIFGAEKKDIIRIIFIEYAVICGIAWIVGNTIGIPFVFLIEHIFIREGVVIDTQPFWLINNIRTTLGYMVCILGIAVIINLIKLYQYSVAQLLVYKEQRGYVPSTKLNIIGIVIGGICFIGAIILFQISPITYTRLKYGTLLCLGGLYLWFTYLGNFLLLFIKRYDKWYDKHIFQIKMFYYRFSENKNIILISFIINVFVLVVVNINVVEYGNLSSKYLWKYPYDYVCMTEERYVDIIHNEIQTPEEKLQIIPYVFLESNDGGEYIGISESAYERITTKREKLNEGEIKAIFQKADQDNEKIFDSSQVYLKRGHEILPFIIKDEVKEILFVAQQSEMIRILVMNDEDFTLMYANQGNNKIIITQNRMGKEDLDVRRLKMIEDKYDIISFSKADLMMQDKQGDITSLIYYICIGIFLIISNMTILFIKMWTDIPVLSKKYDFLKIMGMDERELEKNIKKEVSICLWISFWISLGVSSVVIFFTLIGKEHLLIVQIIVLFASILLIQLMYIITIRRYGYKAII